MFFSKKKCNHYIAAGGIVTFIGICILAVQRLGLENFYVVLFVGVGLLVYGLLQRYLS